MNREGFLGDADTFLLFFKMCARYNIIDESKRIELLRKLVAHKRIKYLRQPDEYLKGKKCLRIK